MRRREYALLFWQAEHGPICLLSAPLSSLSAGERLLPGLGLCSAPGAPGTLATLHYYLHVSERGSSPESGVPTVCARSAIAAESTVRSLRFASPGKVDRTMSRGMRCFLSGF